MKQTATVKKMAMIVLVGSVEFGVWAEGPTVSDVTVRQRWPWSRLVDIDYTLDCEDAQTFDVRLSAFDGKTALPLPDASLTGDLYGVSRGARRIVWDPMRTDYTNQLLMRFNVDLTPTNVPVYAVIDLTAAPGTSNQIEYVYPDDTRLTTEGQYTNVWFGVTNDAIYATDKLVLRRIRAGSFKMGDTVPPRVSTTLTKDFYVGVFEVTEAQWTKIMGGSSTSTKPKASVSYNSVRGATNNVPSVDWHTTGTTVSPTSFIGLLRSRTGIGTFDLPTEAQWEYFCRAGTACYYNAFYYNDGESSSSSDTNVLNRLGWWVSNSGSTRNVGGKEANLWGLYDTQGNVWEHCLDWYGAALSGGADPTGPQTGSTRLIHGGSVTSDAISCRIGFRHNIVPTYASGSVGFRVVAFPWQP